VTDRNFAPVAVADGLPDIAVGQSTLIAAAALLSNDTDADGDGLRITGVGGAFLGSVALTAGGDVLFTSDGSGVGPDGFSYTVTDGVATATGRASFAVVQPNRAPTPQRDAFVLSGTGTTVLTAASLLGNDSDPDGDDLTITSISGGTIGTATLGPDGNITYVGGGASDVLTYTVSDGALSATAEIALDMIGSQIAGPSPSGPDGAGDGPGPVAPNGPAAPGSEDPPGGFGGPGGPSGPDVEPGSGSGSGTGTGGTVGDGGEGSGTGGDPAGPTDGPDRPGTGGSQTPITGPEGDETQMGTSGDDDLTGGTGDDDSSGGGGNDTITGGPGDDDLSGGPGDDNIQSGANDDAVRGGPGDDALGGRRGDDTIRGGPGDDSIGGGRGNDSLFGGPGDDSLFGRMGQDLLVGRSGDDLLVGRAGADLLFGNRGADRLLGGRGPDELHGGRGADVVFGGQGNDIAFGGGGADRIRGGRGDDTVDGGVGADRLVGGPGDDVLIGGPGPDTFVIREGAADEVDVIADFDPGLDRLILSGAVDRYLPAPGGGILIEFASGHQLLVEGSGAMDLLGSDPF